MLLSVIIPTYNRSRLLARAIQAICKQSLSYEKFELIIVDNGSGDDTSSVVDSFSSILPNLRYIRESTPGLHAARHAGLRAARGDILVYGDDDIRPSPTWLLGVVEAFSQPGTVLSGGPCRPEFEQEPPTWIEELKEYVPQLPEAWYFYSYSLIDLGDRWLKIPADWVFGCNYAVRRQIVEDAGGFRPDSMPSNLLRYRGDGETGLSRAIAKSGGNIIYSPKASVSHWVSTERMTPNYLFKRQFNEGITFSYSLIRQKGGLTEDLSSYAPVLPEFSEKNLKYQMGREKLNGFLYHQSEVRNDKKLLEWVLRETYLGKEAI